MEKRAYIINGTLVLARVGRPEEMTPEQAERVQKEKDMMRASFGIPLAEDVLVLVDAQIYTSQEIQTLPVLLVRTAQIAAVGFGG